MEVLSEKLLIFSVFGFYVGFKLHVKMYFSKNFYIVPFTLFCFSSGDCSAASLSIGRMNLSSHVINTSSVDTGNALGANDLKKDFNFKLLYRF